MFIANTHLLSQVAWDQILYQFTFIIWAENEKGERKILVQDRLYSQTIGRFFYEQNELMRAHRASDAAWDLDSLG